MATHAKQRSAQGSSPGEEPENIFPPEIAVSIIDRHHPDHLEWAGSWRKYQALAEGGKRLFDMASEFLIKRLQEPSDTYQKRLEAFTAETPVGNALAWYDAALFGHDPEISQHLADKHGNVVEGDVAEDTLATIARISANIEGTESGKSFVDLWRQIFRMLATYESVWILVDRRKVPEDLTQQDLKDPDYDPYLVVYSPLDVINWSMDDSGRLTQVVLYSEFEEQDILTETVRTVHRWVYYDSFSFAIYERGRQEEPDKEKDVAMRVSEGRHSTTEQGRVPFLRFTIPRVLWLLNRAILPSMAHIDLDNTISWMLRVANLPHPVVFTNEDKISGNLSETEMLQLGADDRFEWAEPSGTSLAIATQNLAAKREEIFRSMHLMSQARDSSATASAQSGESKKQDVMPALNILESIGDCLRPFMKATLELILKVADIDDVVVSVRGFQFITDDPAVISKTRENAVAADLGSGRLILELNKSLAKASLPDVDPLTAQIVEAEIEKAGDPLKRIEKRREDLKNDAEALFAEASA